MKLKPACITAALTLGDGAALAVLRPHLGQLAGEVRAPHAWIDRVGLDGALGGLAVAGLWFAAAWLAVGLLAAGASHLPGVAGRLGGYASHLLLPRVLRSLLAGGAGLGVLIAPVTAQASGALGTPAADRPVTALRIAFAHDAPDGPDRSPRRVRDGAGVPSPEWPTDAGARVDDPPPTPSWPVRHRPTHERSSTRPATVHRGESLWVIAARRLGSHAAPADVAADWPRWYAANRRVIGDDPDLIVPGQVLRAPAATAEEAHP